MLHRLKAALARTSLLLALATTPGCYYIMSSDGGGQAEFKPPRRVDPADVALPAGYRIEAIATGLTFPTGVTFDEAGRVYVTEAGYSYGPERTTPRILRVEPDGSLTAIAAGTNPPWNGLTYHRGHFYVAAGGHLGQLLKIDMRGLPIVLVDELPSLGDHHTNNPVLGPDGWIYFGQGTVTNSAVVGIDNYHFGWLKHWPDFHDVPGADIVLAGENFVTENPLTDDPNDLAVTGAYVPFGKPTVPGQVIRGRTKCSGSVLRVRPDGSNLELVAWGFRNPFGLSFAPDGKLYLTENGYDVRGSRPVYGTADFMHEVKPGLWYGWPDYVGGMPITDKRFQPPGKKQPDFLLARHPNIPPKPVAHLGVHSSSNGFDFSRSAAFGHQGEAFVAQFGDMAPDVGKVLSPVGFKVVRVNVKTGVVQDFAVNRERTAPASKLESGGLERPVAARFDPSGQALYVVDFGVLTTKEDGVEPHKGTGVLWRITRQARR